jgi:hypothetical protein
VKSVLYGFCAIMFFSYVVIVILNMVKFYKFFNCVVHNLEHVSTVEVMVQENRSNISFAVNPGTKMV